MAHFDLLRRRLGLAHPALRLHYLLFQPGARRPVWTPAPPGLATDAPWPLRWPGWLPPAPPRRPWPASPRGPTAAWRPRLSRTARGSGRHPRRRGWLPPGRRIAGLRLVPGRLGRANRGGILRGACLQDLHLLPSRASRGAGLGQDRAGYGRSEQQIRLRAIRPRGDIGQAGAGLRRARLVIASVDFRDRVAAVDVLVVLARTPEAPGPATRGLT